jgi:NADH dehydrogenase
VVILGGGFAGYYSARALEKRMRASERDEIEVTLVARDNYLTFTPMLPSVPASTLAPRHVVTPLRARLSHTRFIRAEITDIDPKQKTIRLEGASVRTGVTPATITYDDLVVGLGSTTNYFNVPGAAENALTMKSVPDAMKIRNRVLDLLEAADAQDSERRRRQILTLVIVGVGFSGCETAGELIEFLRESIKLYPRIKPADLRVLLVGLDAECMPEIGERLGRYGRKVLAEDGVEIRLKTAVTSIAEDHVMLKNPDGASERVDSRTVVWTAGVAPLPAAKPLATEGSKGRVLTDRMLRSPHWDGVWALGDGAAIPNTEGAGFCAPTAQHAMRQAETLAHNVLASHRGAPLEPYTYRPLGLMASLGHHKAVALAMGIPISGFIAWWLWRTYYLLRMPGFERKLRVALDWTIDLLLPRDTVILRYGPAYELPITTSPPPRQLTSAPPLSASPLAETPAPSTSRTSQEADTAVDPLPRAPMSLGCAHVRAPSLPRARPGVARRMCSPSRIAGGQTRRASPGLHPHRERGSLRRRRLLAHRAHRQRLLAARRVLRRDRREPFADHDADPGRSERRRGDVARLARARLHGDGELRARELSASCVGFVRAGARDDELR